jgi:CBS domain-containing protein
MRVSEVLKAKGSAVATISSEATVRQAVAELARHEIGALVVSPDGMRIEGIVSERDVVRRLHDRPGSLLDDPVAQIMSEAVETCSPDDDVESLMTTMTERRFRHVPVVEGGCLVGIVSIGDVVKSRIGELERDRAELVDYINAR